MAAFDYTYETVYFETDVYLGINWMGRMHFFERPIVEVLHDTKLDLFYLLCTDMASDKPTGCFPLRDLVADWRRLVGLEAPEELKELSA
jgi:hypothetical protein